ncbi:MAG TPA: hypothetical protein VMI32_14715 [Candidatus Solibacter sp.]|nr:hypothetical protein [Candidatus Solibacter sp.]
MSGMAGLLTIGGGVEGSCMVVGDTAGNTGLLCCGGLGGGYVAGAAASGGVATAICPTCATICDMEGGGVQGEGFGATGPGLAAGGGVSVDMKNAMIFANAGPAIGEGGGVVVLATTCKLVLGGKRCKDCPSSEK